ncbi:MAG: alpha/beta hydrolase [Methanomicrobiales archaeon HGW-Methanomicrobiales-3]|jgi:acetyl esterase/lipase|nr:MAG: alpha/beta hydrolase [Methanomicrobiales archaeon HGW-Methanomicrobiales-3]
MIHNAPDELLTLLQENAPDSTLPVPALRQGFSDLYKEMQQESLSSSDYQIEKVPLRDGAVGYWITLSEVMSDRVILFFHGGGFTLGSTDDHLGLCVRLARASRARVFSVDYRLAPEHTFPAPVNDAVTAWKYLIAKGFLPHHILPVGISAGGNLVLGLLLTLRDGGMRLPAAGILMSPAVDLLFSGESVTKNAGRDWITAGRLQSIRRTYLGGRDPNHPLASPTHARLAGLPRLYIQAGTHELLLSDIGKFVDKARWAGVPVQVELWEGMFHCWQIFADEVPEGEEAIDHAGKFAESVLLR